jgi:D-beta-D-heptose 7-phosphate kinase/D-beta-D-heptose 1-phosphate adenosyltransferase
MSLELISRFQNFSVLVIGDLIIDCYLQGISTRLTPEAAVPVVDILEQKMALGGAANTAVNLRNLGAKVTFCSVAGLDRDGDDAIALLQKYDVDQQVVQDPLRNTIVKTRVMTGDQLLVRYDGGSENTVSSELEQQLISLLEEQYFLHDAIVIADYGKGVITPLIIDALRALKMREDKFIAVDSKRLGMFKCLSPSLVKPNYKEAIELLRLQQQRIDRTQQIQELGKKLFETTGAAVTVVTMDKEGAAVFCRDQQIYRCCARELAPRQVSGAGDVYISAFTLSLLAGADMSAAAEVSSAAAGLAIGKDITAHCTHEELGAYMSISEKCIDDLQQLKNLCTMYRAQGKKIVFTNGCFDILHSGHVNYLNKARELGNILIVGINTDESIKRLKGSSRPINHLSDRIQVLSGLSAVSHVIPFGRTGNDTPVSLIEMIKPDIFVKGSDYSKETLPEAGLVEELGGKVMLLPLLPDRSTTGILRRINSTYMASLAQ